MTPQINIVIFGDNMMHTSRHKHILMSIGDSIFKNTLLTAQIIRHIGIINKK
jgi:hypothetical protein